MDESDVETVILVCDDEANSRTLLQKLMDQGIGVVGLATSVAQAKNLAAQTFANIAVLAPHPTEGPLGRDLARDLMDTWGVRSLILEDHAQHDWAPAPGQTARLRSALGAEAQHA
jgi:CheY-like chemotaxis protein